LSDKVIASPLKSTAEIPSAGDITPHTKIKLSPLGDIDTVWVVVSSAATCAPNAIAINQYLKPTSILLNF
jgi:hypothetical protein